MTSEIRDESMIRDGNTGEGRFNRSVIRGRHWRDSHTPGLLKSAVQKAIRRGDLGLLRWALDRVWRRAEGRAWICRRLPILAGEELWPYLGWVGYTARAAQGLLKRPEEVEVAKKLVEGTLGAMATVIKNKDGDGVQLLAHWQEPEVASPDALIQALETAQPVGAAATTFGLLTQKINPWSLLLARAANHGAMESLLAIHEARIRYGSGALEDDRRLLVGTAVLAALHPQQTAPRLRLQTIGGQPTPPGWAVADMHTETGRRVLSEVAKHRGISREKLSDLWFYFESALLNGEETDGWWPKAVEARFAALGYPSLVAARTEWDQIRSEVQARVEAALPAAIAEVDRWAQG